jgi:putative selenium metabolism protein SsnA
VDPILVAHGTLLTFGPEGRVLPDHGLLIQGDRIARLAPMAEFEAFGGRRIDARNRVVLPGLVNAHMHFYSTFARGLAKVAPSRDFQGVLENLWWKLDRALDLEGVELSAQAVLFDAIRKGTTTLIDHHASPHAVRGSLDRIARAVKTMGLRACLCFEVSDRDGVAVAEAGLEENAAFIQGCGTDPQLRALFGLHASFTVGERTLRRAAELGQSLGAGFHLHVAEDRSDQAACLQDHGMRVVERLDAAGLLGPDTIAAHAVHLSPTERALLADSGTWVVHNPQSNLNNAVGIADVGALVAAGVRVALGTDAMTVNMLEELRMGLWAQHQGQASPSCAFGELVGALTVQNPALATRLWGSPLGVLAEGALADVITVDYLSPTPLETANAGGHLVFGISQGTVDTTICGGRVLMEGKRLRLDVDEAEVAARCRVQAEKVWQAF